MPECLKTWLISAAAILLFIWGIAAVVWVDDYLECEVVQKETLQEEASMEKLHLVH